MAPGKKIEQPSKESRPSKKKTSAASPGRRKAAAGKRPAAKRAAVGDDFPIVGVGASAGGLEALEAFFARLPKKPGIAFVVIQHMSPRHKSHMAELLEKRTSLPCATIVDGGPVEVDTITCQAPPADVRDGMANGLR